MRLAELLSEGKEDKEDKEFNKILKLAKSFLKENKSLLKKEKFLLRGIEIEDKAAITVKRVDLKRKRKPKDLGLAFHKALDSFLNKKFGLRYRSFSKFVTTDHITAKYYGSPHIFIPIGAYKFCYSNLVNDAFDVFSSFYDFCDFVSNKIYKKSAESFYNDLKKYNLVTEEEQKKISDKNNFGFSRNFGGIDRSYFETFFTSFNKMKFDINPNDIALASNFKKYLNDVIFPAFDYRETTSLQEALSTNNEIMVQCEEYILIPYTPKYAKKLKKFLENL